MKVRAMPKSVIVCNEHWVILLPFSILMIAVLVVSKVASGSTICLHVYFFSWKICVVMPRTDMKHDAEWGACPH